MIILYMVFLLPQASDAYHKAGYGQFCSDPETRITDRATCKAAAAALGLEWGNGWWGPYDFPGCLHTRDPRDKVYFNYSPHATDDPSSHPKMANYAEICTGKGKTKKCLESPDTPKKYCQPGQKCWPKPHEVENFSGTINGKDNSCLGLPKFVSKNYTDAHKLNQTGLPYNGLLNNISATFLGNHSVGGDLHVCKTKKLSVSNYAQPDPNCDSNPFITGTSYKNGSDFNISIMSPYQYLTNRNYKLEWMAAFIVTAESPDDISKALVFANKHNLGVAVMSTGHGLQDRNAGPGPNSLLIRTTCFNDFDAKFKDIEDYDNKTWSEGYAVVGAGLTNGPNYWYDIKNGEGLYNLAYNKGREIVGGTCHSVGIVGFMLGGGIGWTTPMYGLGVDNLLHVDMVLANGTITSANFTHNKELFKAVRGGGPGFGVITSLKIKLHEPVCETMKNCYQFWNASWVGPYTGDKDQINEIKYVLTAMFNWTATYKLNWNSKIDLSYYPDTKKFNLSIISGHFGTEEMDKENYNSFSTALKNLNITNTVHLFNNKPIEENQPPIVTDKYFCEIFPNQDNTSECYFYPMTLQRWSQYIRFLVNSTTTLKETEINGTKTNEFLDALISNWQPMCDQNPYSACASGFHLDYFFTNGNKTYNTGGAISPGFRDAAVQVLNTGVNTNSLHHMTFEQKESWMHYNLAPAMYKFSNASYFNTAEYTLNPGQWEDRFWGKEIYAELLRIKEKYDPEYRLNCRHCVGSKI